MNEIRGDGFEETLGVFCGAGRVYDIRGTGRWGYARRGGAGSGAGTGDRREGRNGFRDGGYGRCRPGRKSRCGAFGSAKRVRGGAFYADGGACDRDKPGVVPCAAGLRESAASSGGEIIPGDGEN